MSVSQSVNQATMITAMFLGEREEAAVTTIDAVRAVVITRDPQPHVWIALDDIRRNVSDIGQLSFCFVSYAVSDDVPSQRKIIYLLDSDVIRLLMRHQSNHAKDFLHWLVPNVFIHLVYQHNLKLYSTRNRLTLRREACAIYADIIKKIILE